MNTSGIARRESGFRSRPLPGLVAAIALSTSLASAQGRARELGIPFSGRPGAWNAITDVPGVEVGHVTLIEGEGPLEAGKGPVRTGLTVVLPRGRSADPVFAGWFSLNGNGELTGTTWVKESGFLEGPIAITNTHSVGVVRDTIISWQSDNGLLFQPWSLPVVGETYDGYLNDINGFHVKREDVLEALGLAAAGPVAEGSVGGGTGMICYGFKGGIGTASRIVAVGEAPERTYTVAALVQANFGSRSDLTIAGVPVGRELSRIPSPWDDGEDLGSIIIVVATDAPLLPHQLERLARRASLGVARTGATSGNGSGDIFIAFSTANAGAASSSVEVGVAMTPNGSLNPIFAATVESVEEAIVNALVAGRTMTGVDGHRVEALPHEELKRVLAKYNRIAP
jgi:L-aminopeptidase/D-esterase-like protein